MTFQKELEQLINKHCVDNSCDIPDYLLAEHLVSYIVILGYTVKKTLDWHGTDSVCHPKKSNQPKG